MEMLMTNRSRHKFVAGVSCVCRECELELSWDEFHRNIWNALVQLPNHTKGFKQHELYAAEKTGLISFPYTPIRYICKKCLSYTQKKKAIIKRDYEAYKERELRKAQIHYGKRLGLTEEETTDVAFVYDLIFNIEGITSVYIGRTIQAPKLRFQGHSYTKELQDINEVSEFVKEPLDNSLIDRLIASKTLLIPKIFPSCQVHPHRSRRDAFLAEQARYDNLVAGRIFEGKCKVLNKVRPTGSIQEDNKG